MNYNELREETKLFLNKAMDIYATIEDKSIELNLTGKYILSNYNFTLVDKKVLSLFIAGFLIDGNLKKYFLNMMTLN